VNNTKNPGLECNGCAISTFFCADFASIFFWIFSELWNHHRLMNESLSCLEHVLVLV